MGWSSSWVAVQGPGKAEVLDALGLEETGKEAVPGERTADLSCRELEDGWVVIFSEDFDWGPRERVLELSRLGLAVGCQFEDRVMMTSVACAAEQGRELWRVFHDSEKSVFRLDVTGEPPAAFLSIKEKLIQTQEDEGGEKADVDHLHDAPLELAKAVCGYRHDDEILAFIGLRACGSGSELRAPEFEPGELQANPQPRSSSSLIGRLFAPFKRR